MGVDAYNPGPDGSYPHWPRDAQGRPLTTQAEAEAADSGMFVPSGTGISADRDRDGNRKRHHLTPRTPDGTPIVPPTTPLAP